MVGNMEEEGHALLRAAGIEPVRELQRWIQIAPFEAEKKVAVLEQGKMMGPALYRNALQLLLLDRIYLEEYYGDRMDMEAVVDGYTLKVKVHNTYNKAVSGNLQIVGTPGEQLAPKPVPTYKGWGGIYGDFIHCVKTRETPFRDIERAVDDSVLLTGPLGILRGHLHQRDGRPIASAKRAARSLVVVNSSRAWATSDAVA